MSENTNTFITGEVYPYQITDRTLSFIPKLSPAADDHFKELVTGKIKISLYDFSNGKGDNGIYTYFNLDLKQFRYIYERAKLSHLPAPYESSKIHCQSVETDGPFKGYCKSFRFYLARNATYIDKKTGETCTMRAPWYLKITNGYAIPGKDGKGEQRNSFKQTSSAYINLSDEDFLDRILSSYPSDSANIYEVLMKGKKTYIAGLHLFFLLILITALFIFTVWLQDTEKKIPVTYSGKLQGKSTFKGVSTNTIPIKLCPGGVVPIIFASSLISFPILIAQIAGAKQNAVLKLLNSGYWFNTSKPWYTFGALIYLVLIFAFSYFYTEITMNPEEIANNIKKSGGNIAGIRAGSSTAEYLRKQMKYLIAIGSFCLCIIAIIPFIVSGLTGLSRLSFFGTSIIITVSVILETKKLILSKTQENYYMNRVKKGGLFRG